MPFQPTTYTSAAAAAPVRSPSGPLALADDPLKLIGSVGFRRADGTAHATRLFGVRPEEHPPRGFREFHQAIAFARYDALPGRAHVIAWERERQVFVAYRVSPPKIRQDDRNPVAGGLAYRFNAKDPEIVGLVDPGGKYTTSVPR